MLPATGSGAGPRCWVVRSGTRCRPSCTARPTGHWASTGGPTTPSTAGRTNSRALVGGAGPEWAGFSVTMPGKHAAFEVADRRTDGAELVGAANTLLPGADGWTAANTDVDGIVGALRPEGPRRAGHRPARARGGTAQAALVAARRLGARRGPRHGARPGPGRAVAGDRRAGRGRPGRAQRGRAADAERRLDGAEVLISTVPADAADPLADRAWSRSRRAPRRGLRGLADRAGPGGERPRWTGGERHGDAVAPGRGAGAVDDGAPCAAGADARRPAGRAVAGR